MHEAFVQDAQHDVHRDQRRQDQPGLLRQRLLQRRRRTLEAGLDLIRRQADARHRCVDGALGAELIGAFKRYIENPMGMLV